MRTATIEKAEYWDALAGGVNRVRWAMRLVGGGFDGHTIYKPTRREAREWCDEFGYEWR